MQDNQSKPTGRFFITVQAEPLHPLSKYYYVSSPDMPGICLVGKEPGAIFKKIPQIIKILFKKNYGIDVVAIIMGDLEDLPLAEDSVRLSLKLAA